jgi:DNA-binding transcriptional MerR regulator
LDKAPDAFRTISEVADELDLPQHVLRFWESRFPHIKPLKRGGGRRYYRPEDIDLLRGIRRLLYADGYTIRGVQRILREQGVRTVQSVGHGQEDLGVLPLDGELNGDDTSNGAPALNMIVAPVSDRLNEYETDAEQRDRTSDLLRPRPAPKIRRIANDQVAVAPVAKLETAAEPGPVTVAWASGASATAAAKPVAASGPPGLAQQDLDRLQRVLAELEACRRLLDK